MSDQPKQLPPQFTVWFEIKNQFGEFKSLESVMNTQAVEVYKANLGNGTLSSLTIPLVTQAGAGEKTARFPQHWLEKSIIILHEKPYHPPPVQDKKPEGM